MARSRKKTPGFCGSSTWWKRYANKRVRQRKGKISDGCRYKRITCSYYICDWKHLCWTKRQLEYWTKGKIWRAYKK